MIGAHLGVVNVGGGVGQKNFKISESAADRNALGDGECVVPVIL